MRIIGLAAALSLASAGAVQAGVWVRAAHTDHITVGLNTEIIRREGSRVMVWTVWIEKTTRLLDGKPYDYRVSRMTFDCAAQTSRTNSMLHYSLNSEAPVSIAGASPSDEPVVPGSLNAAVMNLACNPPAGTGPDISSLDYVRQIRRNWPI